MANVCSWCGECIEEDGESPLDVVCHKCYEDVQNASCAAALHPWQPWSAAKDYKVEPMKRTDRF